MILAAGTIVAAPAAAMPRVTPEGRAMAVRIQDALFRAESRRDVFPVRQQPVTLVENLFHQDPNIMAAAVGANIMVGSLVVIPAGRPHTSIEYSPRHKKVCPR